MSKRKSTKKSNPLSGIKLDLSLADTVVPIVKPAIDTVCKQIDAVTEEHRQLIKVPELYSEGFPLTSDQATKMLEELGLSFELIPVQKADPKFCDCFDSQVVETLPAAKQKVQPGTKVLVKYVTQDIIDKSRRMAEEAEQTALVEETKTSKSERGTSETIHSVKNGVQKISSIFNKKTGGQ